MFFYTRHKRSEMIPKWRLNWSIQTAYISLQPTVTDSTYVESVGMTEINSEINTGVMIDIHALPSYLSMTAA